MADRSGDKLTQRLAAIRASHPGSEPEMVAEVVHAVLATMSGDLSAQETSLLAEVEALGNTIACAKAEIAALRFDDITDNHIPFATDERSWNTPRPPRMRSLRPVKRSTAWQGRSVVNPP